jgi:hypothetical protein
MRIYITMLKINESFLQVLVTKCMSPSLEYLNAANYNDNDTFLFGHKINQHASMRSTAFGMTLAIPENTIGHHNISRLNHVQFHTQTKTWKTYRGLTK